MPRPRKPTTQHILEGTLRPQRHSERADANIKQSKLRMPRGLSSEQKKIWKAIDENLPDGVVGKLDEASMTAMLVAYQNWLDNIDKPDLADRRFGLECLKEFNRMAGRFGLTPADRARLQVPTAQKTDNQDDRFLGVVG